MNTSKWGPSSWHTFFIYSRNYPVEIDLKNKEHRQIKSWTKKFYRALEFILPCKYCRESYKIFWKQLPIDDYLDSRQSLTFWLYTLKNLVNQKLIKQEQKNFEEKMAELIKNKKATKKNIEALKKKIFYTKPTPKFEDVVKYYEQFRAGCSEKTKSCRL